MRDFGNKRYRRCSAYHTEGIKQTNIYENRSKLATETIQRPGRAFSAVGQTIWNSLPPDEMRPSGTSSSCISSDNHIRHSACISGTIEQRKQTTVFTGAIETFVLTCQDSDTYSARNDPTCTTVVIPTLNTFVDDLEIDSKVVLARLRRLKGRVVDSDVTRPPAGAQSVSLAYDALRAQMNSRVMNQTPTGSHSTIEGATNHHDLVVGTADSERLSLAVLTDSCNKENCGTKAAEVFAHF